MATSRSARKPLDLTVHPATPERWNDLVKVFAPRASNSNSCWCQRFRVHDDASNREALYREVEAASVPIGLLAYTNGQPVGWTRVVPRTTLPGILKNRALRGVLDDDPNAWWVACFAVPPAYRRTGVGLALLRAAAEQARKHEASVLDGHPVDAKNLKAARVSGSALFTGTVGTFESAGFQEIGRTYPSRPVMRLDIHSSPSVR